MHGQIEWRSTKYIIVRPNEAKITVDFDLRMYVLQYLHLTALWPKEKPKKGLFSVYPKKHY